LQNETEREQYKTVTILVLTLKNSFCESFYEDRVLKDKNEIKIITENNCGFNPTYVYYRAPEDVE